MDDFTLPSAKHGLLAALVLALAACGDGETSMADASHAQVSEMTPGVTPFIEILQLRSASLSGLTSINYVIAARPGASAKPVNVTYSAAALQRQGYSAAADGSMSVPIFGLYAGYSNTVSVTLSFRDGSVERLPVTIATAAYVDPTGIYTDPTILVKRSPSSALGYDYFVIKSSISSPIIIDTDAQVRWAVPGMTKSGSTAIENGGFVVGKADSTNLARVTLDGALTTAQTNDPTFKSFHHNIDPGKLGFLAEFDVDENGINNLESTVAEITRDGAVLKKWDFAALISDYMRANGDDPTLFVRPGQDWFHMNASYYDPSDDSLVVSSRENFVMKVGYQSGEIIWILGDPTKYWHTFSSLRAKALTLQGAGLYPIGQHGISMTVDGLLLLFNDGLGSLNQPAGAPAGETRSYSAVSAYRIDASQMTAQEAWRFDYGQTIYSDVCSSAYQSQDQSALVTYATADARKAARLVGLDQQHNVVFDFKYVSPTPCGTAWNALPIQLTAMNIN